jgi:hypothetical protein
VIATAGMAQLHTCPIPHRGIGCGPLVFDANAAKALVRGLGAGAFTTKSSRRPSHRRTLGRDLADGRIVCGSSPLGTIGQPSASLTALASAEAMSVPSGAFVRVVKTTMVVSVSGLRKIAVW